MNLWAKWFPYFLWVGGGGLFLNYMEEDHSESYKGKTGKIAEKFMKTNLE